MFQYFPSTSDLGRHYCFSFQPTLQRGWKRYCLLRRGTYRQNRKCMNISWYVLHTSQSSICMFSIPSYSSSSESWLLFSSSEESSSSSDSERDTFSHSIPGSNGFNSPGTNKQVHCTYMITVSFFSSNPALRFSTVSKVKG